MAHSTRNFRRTLLILLGLSCMTSGVTCPGRLADAGADQSVAVGDTVTLSGSGSTDANGDTLTFSWTQTGGQKVTLAGANTATATFTAPSAAATLTFELTVSDGQGAIATDSVTVAVISVVLSLGGPGVSLLDPTTLISALPVNNTGSDAAENVQVTAIKLNGGTLTSPIMLPLNLGTIPPDGSVIVDIDFSGDFAPVESYALTVQGTFVVENATRPFTLESNLVIPPAAPASALVTTVTVEPNQVTDAPFPPQPRSFSDKFNPPLWTVPTAPFVPGTPTPTGTDVQPAKIDEPPNKVLQSHGGSHTVVFTVNNGLGLTSGNTNGTTITIAEPSGASNGASMIFATTNLVAAFSPDSGITVTEWDPTTVFPADTVGFCCDQIVQYVPSIDRFIWLLQGSTTATQSGGYRLASASPADVISRGRRAWTYWNLTPTVFGQPVGTGFDYPDMSVGNNFLYLGWDAGFGCPAGCSQGFQVARVPLNQIQTSSTITIGFTNPSNGPMAWGSHISQNTLDEVFWAGHNNNSQMRVFSLAEGSNSYFWRDVGIASWANDSPTSTTPDGRDWLGKNFSGTGGGGAFPRNGVIGATRSGNQIWFAWSAGTDTNFQRAHVEMVTLDRSNNFNVIQQVQVWNNNFSFAYPALATNACTGEIGLSFEFGGGGNYENHVVGFWGDFVAYITTGSDVGTTRFGDYVTIRQEPSTQTNPGNLFNAFGYGLNSIPPPGAGTLVDVHYVLFGRPPTSCGPD